MCVLRISVETVKMIKFKCWDMCQQMYITWDETIL